MKDVGKYKAEVAAEFIMKRIPSCKVIPYTKKVNIFILFIDIRISH